MGRGWGERREGDGGDEERTVCIDRKRCGVKSWCSSALGTRLNIDLEQSLDNLCFW